MLLFFVSQSPKDGAHKAELRASGNTLHNCIFSSRPLSITRQAHKDTTAQPAAALLFGWSVSYPVVSLTRREMLLHVLLKCQRGARGLHFFFSLSKDILSQS